MSIRGRHVRVIWLDIGYAHVEPLDWVRKFCNYRGGLLVLLDLLGRSAIGFCTVGKGMSKVAGASRESLGEEGVRDWTEGIGVEGEMEVKEGHSKLYCTSSRTRNK